MRITDNFVFFWGGIYSNWYKSSMVIDDITFCCVEQYMMYKKASIFQDEKMMNLILSTSNPQLHKSYGRKVKNFDISVWNSKCRDIVYTGCLAKFSQNTSLKEKILKDGCGRKFVEASAYDRIWGIGMTETDERVEFPEQWNGTNWLGEILDKVYRTLLDKK